MPPGFTNYSKWDKLELSDDEDPHPGAKFIEANTLRRIKRESHEVKEQQRQEEVKRLQGEQAKDDAAFRELEAKCAALSVAGDEAAAEHARGALWALQKAMDDRASALARLERERRFNADELCYVSKEKSLVGSAACKPDTVKEVSYEDFVALHKAAMEEYASRVRSYDDNCAFFEAHPELLHEHAMGYLLMEALQHGMDARMDDMRRVVKQKYHIKSLLDLAEAHKAHPRGLVTGFFRRLADSPSVAAEYEKAGDDLYTALVKRAGEKRKERDAERLAAEQGGGSGSEAPVVLAREERLGPGGLDPVEVFASLPEPLQTAYESRDVEALRQFIDGCELQEAKRLMRLMVDSGLWVATPGEEGSLLRDD